MASILLGEINRLRSYYDCKPGSRVCSHHRYSMLKRFSFVRHFENDTRWNIFIVINR